MKLHWQGLPRQRRGGGRSLFALTAAAAVVAGCGNGSAGKDLTGSVSVAIQQVPSDVACVRIEAVGPARTASHDYDVKAGQSSVLTMTGVPTGAVSFYGSAFQGSCDKLSPGDQPTWIGDPVKATIEAGKTQGILIALVPNGHVRIAVDFKIDPVTGAPCVSKEAGCLDPDDAFGKADQPAPDGARMISGPEFVARLNDTGLDLDSLNIEARAQATHERKAGGDQAFVEQMLSDRPDLLAWLKAPPTEDDNLRKAGDGYDLSFTDEAGARHTVRTLGKDFTFGAVADSLRRFHTHDNQAGIYDALYASLPADYKARNQLLPPERVHALEAAEIEKLNLGIAADLQTVLGLILPTELQPPKCADEEGTPATPGDETGSCKPAGLFAQKSFPLRPFVTCVKDQGNRGSCVSFGITGAVESNIASQKHRWVNLAEERLYYWAKVPTPYGDGLDTAGVMSSMALSGFKFPWEYQWDYNRSPSRHDWDPIPLYTNSCVGYSGEHCSDTAHQGDLVCTDVLGFKFCAYDGSAPGSSGFKLTGSMELWAFGSGLANSMARMFLALKIPMVLSFAVTPSFDHAASNGIATWFGPFEGNRGGHAVEMVGFIDNDKLPAGTQPGAGGGYYIIKNSWGSCWKDGGYIYLPYQWVNDYAYSMVAAFAQ